jgi:purine-nucleoside phosphorylase
MLSRIKKSVDFIRNEFGQNPKADIALILGSGLGDFVNKVEIVKSIPYEKIPGFTKSGVEGHMGNLVLAFYENRYLIILQGRHHFYEGLTMEALIFPIRVLKYLGIKILLLSNASGGMNPEFSTGDLMIISDHINLMPNPLIGRHYPDFGPRFPDMSEAYSKHLIEKAVKIAGENKIKVKQGVYIGVTGPSYETAAEYNYFRFIGGDAVGMSTVPEVIAARQMGIICFALSVITDLGIPGKVEFLSHEIVQKVASEAEPALALLFTKLIKQISVD